MKILFYIALHKRLKVTTMVFDHLEKLQEDFDFDVFCVCSSLEEAELCNKYGWNWSIEENFPLGRKFNAGLEEAMKMDFTHLVQLGSDDLITRDLMEEYKKYETCDYFGVNTYIAVDLENKKARRWIYGQIGNEINHPIGAGRGFSKKALEIVLAKTPLWEDDRQKVLDGQSDIVMIQNGFRAEIIKVPLGIIDIKTEENIWPFETVQGIDIDFKEIEGYFEKG